VPFDAQLHGKNENECEMYGKNECEMLLIMLYLVSVAPLVT